VQHGGDVYGKDLLDLFLDILERYFLETIETIYLCFSFSCLGTQLLKRFGCTTFKTYVVETIVEECLGVISDG